MALVLKKMFQGYFWLFREVADPRANDYYLTSCPFQPLAIGLAYLWFVYKLGPALMKDRPPMKLDKVLMVYNFIQIMLNGYLCYHGTVEAVTRLDWHCSPIEYSTTPESLFVHKIAYLYFVIKMSDLLDTVFFVLKKNYHQITFLHVYHHFGMLAVSWAGVKFLGGGHSIFMGTVNTFVHGAMYSYYFLASWNPEYKKKVWLKKSITQLQMLQFLLFIYIYGRLFFLPDCKFPKFASYMFVPQNVLMLFLFGEFYWRRYIKTDKSAKTH